MKIKKYFFSFLVLTLIAINIHAQDSIAKKFINHFSAGFDVILTKPILLNALPSMEFRTELKDSKWGGKTNVAVLLRPRLEYFTTIVANLDIERSFLLKNKKKMFIGCGPGIGVNTFPSAFPMFNLSFSYPVWKLYFGVQPTIVITNIYSSYMGISCKYRFDKKN